MRKIFTVLFVIASFSSLYSEEYLEDLHHEFEFECKWLEVDQVKEEGVVSKNAVKIGGLSILSELLPHANESDSFLTTTLVSGVSPKAVPIPKGNFWKGKAEIIFTDWLGDVEYTEISGSSFRMAKLKGRVYWRRVMVTHEKPVHDPILDAKLFTGLQ